jgi:hypothetical protein
MDSARLADYALCLVASILATILVIANAIGDVRHDPGIGERIGAIGFGIGQSLGVGVVVVSGSHAASPSYSTTSVVDTNSAMVTGPDQRV